MDSLKLGLMLRNLTTQLEFIRLITVAFDVECYRRLRCLTICETAVGKGSHVLIIARLQTIGGGFPNGEWVSEGGHFMEIWGILSSTTHATERDVGIMSVELKEMLEQEWAGTFI